MRINVPLAALAVLGGLVVQAAPAHALFGREKQLQEQLTTASGRVRQLETERQDLQRRAGELQELVKSLEETHQQVVADRDNLLAQVKRSQVDVQEFDRIRSERDLLERLLKKAAEEERHLKAQLAEFEDRLHSVQQALEENAQQRQALQQQLTQAQSKSKEKQVTQELSALRKEYGELTRVLQAAQREMAEATKRELSSLKRLQKVQGDYTASVAENSTLRNQIRTIPKDVTQIAREHERLVKEAADMHYNLGVLFSERKQYERAAVEFRKVVELRPDDADSHYNLGVIYAEHLPDRDKAMAHFRRYLDLKPDAKDASWVKQYIAQWRAWVAEDRLE